MTIRELFYYYLDITNDHQAAATLVLADVIQHQKPSEPSEPKYLTVSEAARLLHIATGTVYDLCHSGQLDHHRLGTGRGTIRITSVALKSYQQSTPVKSLIH